MRLQELLSPLASQLLIRPPEEMNPRVGRLDYDSRRVGEGSLFFALPGQATDGNRYVAEAVRKGAVAVASELAPGPTGVPWIQVASIRPFMGLSADRFEGSPSRRLRLAGITGTNGKTTTAFLLHSMISQAGPALLLGTIETRLGERRTDSSLTTPESVDLQRTLRLALDEGCERGVLEVSSHALAQSRVFPCHFPVAVFTNLSQDHLDYHRNLEDYFRAKCLLFEAGCNPGLESAVLNLEDPFACRVPLPPGVRRVTFGRSGQADVHPLSHQTSLEGTRLELQLFGRRLSLRSRLAGEYNLSNILAAAAAASLLGAADSEIQRGVEALASVPGRFERIPGPEGVEVVVDYAHTPDALEQTLSLARKLGRGRLLCVFGCGGDRDRGKRARMGAIAARGADQVIITSDNPRSEDPGEIAAQVHAGVPDGADCRIVLDRRQAILLALEQARPGDLVLIAGKGHETYQEIQGEKKPFDDREVARGQA